MKLPVSVLLLLIGSICAQERSISGGSSRRNRFSAGKSQAINFNCPDDFGYYPHPHDCSQYYVCVFGGALLESCTGGLQYSHDLQTCDWPRNVVCNPSAGPGVSTVKVTDPRTNGRDLNRIHPSTESLTSSSHLSRGIDNSIRSSRQPSKSSGTSKSIFDDSVNREARFLVSQDADPQRIIDNRFQAQETSSRTFNVVPSSSPKSKLSFPPSLPVPSNSNRFTPARATTAAPVADKSFYSDLLNSNDTDYYYYYDDFLYDDYFESSPTVTTTQSPRVRTPSRSRGKQEPKKSASPSVLISGNSRRGGSSRSSSSNLSRPSSSSSLPSSPSISSFPSTFTSSSRSSGGRRGSSPLKKGQASQRSSSRSSSSRASSRNKSSSSKNTASGGTPVVVGRTPQRPNPLYPQPPADVPATPCDRNLCKLPDCSCGGKDVPGNVPPQNVPQMVLLTFDDSVNDLNKNLYVELFEKGRVNPNGCPISATFYISHEWTDYAQVQNLYSDGHEIASHSITHSFGEQFTTRKWAQEIGGQREIMSAYGGVRMEDIRGMRAPFLAVGGNNMFRMLYDLNFTYDSSMPVYENNPPSWPYTLDYKLFHDCMIPPCPKNSYPGLWEVPMVMWQDLTGGRCSMGDACTTPPDAEGIYKMLIKNFERHYTTNRSPFGLFYHAAWFTTPHHKEGFIAFLDTIAAMDDVWLVTNWQALQWVRDPTPLSQAKSFPPFQCDYPERPPRCTSPRVCNVWHKGSVRYMKTCHACPESYPWTGNTGIKSSLNDV